MKEKRKLTRRLGQTLGDVALQIGPTIYKASVRNFSVGGMGVVVDYPATSTKQISVHMKRRNKTVMIDADVKHSTPLGGGRWLVGLQLNRLLGMDDL